MPGPLPLDLDTEAMAAAYHAGQSHARIAAGLGVSESLVGKRLREAGVAGRKAGPPRKLAGVEGLEARYRAGETVAELVVALGVGEAAVRNELVRRGVTLRRNGRASPPIPAWAVERYRAGETPARLGAELGITGATVGRRLRRQGLPVRSYLEARGKPHIRTADLARGYRRGVSLDRLAAEYGLCRHAVTNRLRKAGVAIRPNRPYVTPPAPA